MRFVAVAALLLSLIGCGRALYPVHPDELGQPRPTPRRGPGVPVVWDGQRYVPADEMPAAHAARMSSAASAVATSNLTPANVTGRRAAGQHVYFTIEAVNPALNGGTVTREVEVDGKTWARVLHHRRNLCVEAGWFTGASLKLTDCP